MTNAKSGKRNSLANAKAKHKKARSIDRAFSFNLRSKAATLTKVKVEPLDSRYLIGQDEDVLQALHLKEID